MINLKGHGSQRDLERRDQIKRQREEYFSQKKEEIKDPPKEERKNEMIETVQEEPKIENPVIPPEKIQPILNDQKHQQSQMEQSSQNNVPLGLENQEYQYSLQNLPQRQFEPSSGGPRRKFRTIPFESEKRNSEKRVTWEDDEMEEEEEEEDYKPNKRRRKDDTEKTSFMQNLYNSSLTNALYLGGALLFIGLKAIGFKLMESYKENIHDPHANNFRTMAIDSNRTPPPNVSPIQPVLKNRPPTQRSNSINEINFIK